MTPCGFCIKTRPLDRLRPSVAVQSGLPGWTAIFVYGLLCCPAGPGAMPFHRHGAVFRSSAQGRSDGPVFSMSVLRADPAGHATMVHFPVFALFWPSPWCIFRSAKATDMQLW